MRKIVRGSCGMWNNSSKTHKWTVCLYSILLHAPYLTQQSCSVLLQRGSPWWLKKRLNLCLQKTMQVVLLQLHTVNCTVAITGIFIWEKNLFKYEEYKYITFFNISANHVYSLICHFTCDTFTKKIKKQVCSSQCLIIHLSSTRRENCLVVPYVTFPLWGEMPELIHDSFLVHMVLSTWSA